MKTKPITIELFRGCQTKRDVDARFRELAKQYHPDRGGSTAAMQQLNDVRLQAVAALPLDPISEWTAIL